MADFDLVQTDAQVQSILNDGQSAMGASAQTTLTTEYVMLKDTNGIYHKILKSSFTEAIRDTLAGLLVNNDKGTTINQIAAIASGDFGSITPANLASVLGDYTEASRGSVAGQSVTIPFISNRSMIVFYNSARGTKSVNLLNSNIETIKADSNFFWSFSNDGTNIICTCTDSNTSRTNTLYYKYV